MRQAGRFTFTDALLIVLVCGAFFAATRLDRFFSPEVLPVAQVVIFASVALLLTASALRRGLARGATLAYTDELTGLNNRRYFTEVLANRVFEHRSPGHTPALLLLDLDRFKVVNDTLGHPAGDDLLKVVAQRICDSVPVGTFVARLGGDGFAVIANVRDHAEAALLSESVLRGLNHPVPLRGHDIWPNASIGIALNAGQRVSPAELLTMADVALYQAKARGKGRAFLFDSNARLPSISKLSMESELHMAMKYGEFEMLYQPIVNLATRRIVGAEALVRWNHPTQGMLTPDVFLSIAEETGIAPALGRWIIEEVGDQTRTWQHLFGDRMSVSINVSAAEFRSLDFVYTLSRLVRDSGAAASGLNFELTEASLSLEDATIKANIAELRRMGFKVAIDDFGVGFSSLSFLQGNRLDALKLDPTFVRDSSDDQRTSRIVRSLVELAHSLGMSVVAEGIETEEQYQRMLHTGCDQGQGYYFARPMPSQQLTELLASDRVTLPPGVPAERRRRNRPWSNRNQPGPSAWPNGAQEQKGA